jgi:hypothetical protein
MGRQTLRQSGGLVVTLPRVTIDVTDIPGGGWSVTVLHGHDRVLVDPYRMDAGSVADIVVPVVPPGRLPAMNEPHHPYCAGDEESLAGLLERLSTDRTKAADVTNYGRWLFECLLAPAWPAIHALPAVRQANGLELALRWPATAGPLHDLLWEAMHDGTDSLAGHRRLLVAVTRVVLCDVPAPKTIERAPRVLLAAGSELTDEVIRPGAMFMGLLRSAEAEGLCLPRVAQQVTVGQLEELCRQFEPDFVQLVAHGEIVDADGDGRGRGVLRMAEKISGGGIVGADRLLPALTAGRPVSSVVLCACRSGSGFARTGAIPLALELVSGGIPVVVAMTGDVSEQACRLYTRRMIASVQAGEPLVEAAARGRRAALIGTEEPGDHIDWAMPALFVASSVDTARPLVNPAVGRRVSRIAAGLGLFEHPLFIGRMPELDVLDQMPPAPGASPGEWEIGCVIIRGKGSIKGQGGTRLLREMGHRLLHRGHVPLLLGPYETPPDSLRAVVAHVLDRMGLFAETVGLRPPVSRLLTAAGLTAPADAAMVETEELQADFNVRVERFRLFDEPLTPAVVRPRLGADLRDLASAAAGLGPPFGRWTTPVILADEVHRWSAVLAELLSLVRASGLGMPDAAIPFIATGSENEAQGAALKSFVDTNAGTPGFRTFDLVRLTAEEAAVGFQWVLLNPWGEHQDVYAAPRDTVAADMTAALDGLRGLPTAVRGNLYVVAHALAAYKKLVAAKDEDAYRQYAERYR